MNSIMKGQSIDALQLRKRMGRDRWHAPEPWGPTGWMMISKPDPEEPKLSSVIVSFIIDTIGARGGDWVHASRTGPGRLPTYAEMCELHKVIWGDHGYSYEMHVPTDQHVNFHQYALHTWGRADGSPILPEFGLLGMV